MFSVGGANSTACHVGIHHVILSHAIAPGEEVANIVKAHRSLER